MEEKLLDTGKELSKIRDRERIMRSQLEAENTWLRRQLEEKESNWPPWKSSPWRHFSVGCHQNHMPFTSKINGCNFR